MKIRYGIEENGNWEDGNNILNISTSFSDLAKKYSLSQDELLKNINGSRDC